MSGKRDGIRKRGDAWEFAISLGRDETGKYPRKYYTVRGTRADAERKRREILHQLDEGTFVDPDRVTLGEYMDDWVRQCEAKGLSPSTIEGYKSIVRAHVKPKLGKVRLQKLTPSQVERLYDDLLDAGLSARSVLGTHRALHSALKRAVRLRLVPRNVTDAVEPPSPKRVTMHALSGADVDRAVKALIEDGNELLYVAALLGLYTGMRRGEICALHWSDVDLKDGTITVAWSLLPLKGGKLLFKTPKSEHVRTITIGPRVVKELKAHKKRQAQERLTAGGGYQDQGLVLARSDGTPYNPNRLSAQWRAFRDDHGFDGVRFHDTRHTHASLLLSGGEKVRHVADRLGHSTTTLTLNTYGHTLPGADREASDLFERMIHDAAKKTANNR